MINIGDAVMTFLADTTQLDQAFARVQSETPQKLQPIQNEAKKVGAVFDTTGAQAKTSGTAIEGTGDSAKGTGDQLAGLAAQGTSAAAVVGATGVAAKGADQALEGTGESTKKAGSAFDGTSDAAKKTAASMDGSGQSAKKAGTEMQGTGLAAKGAGQSMEGAGAQGTLAGAAITASWQRVAKATIDYEITQRALKTAMDNVAKSGGEDVVSMLALAQAQQRAAAASLELTNAQRVANTGLESFSSKARESAAAAGLIGEGIGVGIPKHIRTFIATLPGVSTALSAAFSAVAVLFLIEIVANAVRKIIEFTEASENLRKEWIAIEHDFGVTSDKIQEDIDQQKQKFIELTEGPVAALDYALRHMRSTAEQSLQAVSAELDKVRDREKDQASILNFFIKPSDFLTARAAAKELDDLKTKLIAASDAAKEVAWPSDKTLQYRAMLDLTAQEIETTTKKLQQLTAESMASETALGFSVVNLERTTEKLKVLNAVQSQLQKGLEDDRARTQAKAEEEKKAAAEHAIQTGEARITAERDQDLARIQLDQQTNQVLYQEGKRTFDQVLDSERASLAERFATERDDQQRRIALLKQRPVENEAAIITANGRLRALDIEQKTEELRIDQQSYQHRAELTTSFFNELIAATARGTQSRVDLEVAASEVTRQLFGSESQSYQESRRRIQEAQRQFFQTQIELAAEERKSEDELAADRGQSTVQYYQYLQQTARISAATLLQIQQEQDEQTFALKRSALEAQITKLDQVEMENRRELQSKLTELDSQQEALNSQKISEQKRASLQKTLTEEKNAVVIALDDLSTTEQLKRSETYHALELLDQHHEAQRRLNALKTQDVLESYYQQLGLHSADYYRRETQQAIESYARIALSGRATSNELQEAQEVLTQKAEQYQKVLGKNPSPALLEFMKGLIAQQKQALELQLAIDEAAGLDTSADVAALARLNAAYSQVEKSLNRVSNATAHLSAAQKLEQGVLRLLTHDVTTYGTRTQAVAAIVAGAVQTMADAFLQGSFSIQVAMAAIASAILGAIAKIANKKGEEQLALALGSWPDFTAMAYHFAAATAWFALGVGLSALGGAATNSARGGSNAAPSPQLAGTPIDTTGSATAGGAALEQQPIQTVNVQRFAKGGLTDGSRAEQQPTDSWPVAMMKRFAAGGLTIGNDEITEVVRGPRAGIGFAHSPKLAIYDEGDVPEAHIPLANHRSIPITLNPDGTPAAQLPDGRRIPAHFTRSTDELGLRRLTEHIVRFAMGGMSNWNWNESTKKYAEGGVAQADERSTASEGERRETNIARYELGGVSGLLLPSTTAAIGRSVQQAATVQSASTGGRGEPADSERAAQEAEIAQYASGGDGGGGNVIIHNHIKGDLVDYNHVARKISRQVNKGNARLLSSNSLRVTKKG